MINIIIRKGTNGVGTNGVTAMFMFVDRRTFWALPTYFYLPKSAKAYLFPQSAKNHYFCRRPQYGCFPYDKIQDLFAFDSRLI